MSVLTTDKNITTQIASFVKQQTNVEADPIRKEAFEDFQRLGIPHGKHEEYKYTPIARVLEKNFNFTPSAASGPISNIEQFFIKGIEADTIVFIDGVFSKDYSKISSSDVEVLNLKDAMESKHAAAIQHFGKYADFKNDALSAWNRAAWNEGVFIHVGDNIVVKKPIVIYHIVNATAGEVTVSNRNLFVVGKSSQVTVIEKYDSIGKANHFSNYVTEVVVNENAGFEHYSIQNDNNNRFQRNLTQIYQKNSSRVNTYTFTLNGKFYRNNLNLILDGEGIESHMYGLYLLNNDTLADNHTVVDHMKPNSFSNELYKGILDGSSKGVFNGKIYVRPQAQKTNAYQNNRNVLLTDTASINTKPQLEIWADDVKCSHGCTTGQLDEEALFYLQSRGINKNTARAMMLYAFAGDVVEHVPNPKMKEYVDTLISDRLHKDF
jgi:Fe-S cluster assembly protein SufD